jgi:N-acetylglucosamine-6-phosphate deacetylase
MLSGSVMTLEEAVENFQRFTGTDLATAVRMASSNPFRMLGLAEPLSVGRPANLNIFDEQGKLTGTILRGKLLNASN